jgi:curved DNA-binding protein
MEFKDYYKILEVTPEASQDDIRKAYRKLARKYHPDVSKEKDAEARMRDINEANDVLRDQEKRAAYDQLRLSVSSGGAAPGPGWDRGFEFTGGQGSGPSEAEFHDFFSSLFKQAEHQRRGQTQAGGQTHGQARAQPYKGEDHHADIEISLEDSFAGVTRELALRSVQLDAEGRPQLVNRTLSVKIPVGIRAGQMIRLAGQGMPGEAAGPAGDLFLTVHFAPHPVYQVQGRDLTMKLPVTPWEAACGGKVHAPTLQGEVEVNIAPGSQPATKLRLRGKGLPGDPAGDLYLVLDVVWPPANNEATTAAYQALAKAAPFNPRRHLGVQG